MKKPGPTNIGASVRGRLLKLARERGEDFQLLLTRYANERLLFRLATSEHANQFVLKGAALFTVWTGKPHRATRDLDLLGSGDPAEDRIKAVFLEILAVSVADDGVQFDLASLSVGPIRHDQVYGGVRVELVALVTTADVRLQVDIGFGDAITPQALMIDFPPLLDFPGPRLRAYPSETVVAEKLDAMVQNGIANSRMKDYYDLVILSRFFDFDADLLAQAIRATFERRKTPLPTGLPVGLTSAFAEDPTKKTQWTAFLRKTGAKDLASLAIAVSETARFLEIPLQESSLAAPSKLMWRRGGPWT